MMDLRRIRKVKNIPYQQGDVLYWMNRDLRVEDNWGLYYATLLAETKGVGLHVVYNYDPQFLGGRGRQQQFKKMILQEIEKDVRCQGWGFYLLIGNKWLDQMREICTKVHIGALVTDCSPLRKQRQWLEDLSQYIEVPIYQVDTHNIIPIWVASEKQEFGAYTLRPKIKRLLPEFCTPFPITYPLLEKRISNAIDWEKVICEQDNQLCVSLLHVDKSSITQYIDHVVSTILLNYAGDKNDPTKDATSRLSAYLHYGVIAPQRIALEVQKRCPTNEHTVSFLEELIVRRELADNFCWYNEYYDTPQGFPQWAKNTLEKHRQDERSYLYSLEEFEHAVTHDRLWNAAQMEMVKTGYMHGYMRMYWAKKIFEWSPTVEQAMEVAICLNDRYQLDGRDPNGYVGIAWSMGGVHDRAWVDRPIFGQIRYMNENGCRRKFDVEGYIRKVEGI